jgi:valyl-tRNA synthetase
MVEQWPSGKAKKSGNAEKDFKLIQEIVTAIRNFKNEGKVNPKDVLDCSINTSAKAVKANLHLIEYLAKVKFNSKVIGQKIHLVKADLIIALPVGQSFSADHSAEIANLENYIKLQEQKLNNQQFLSKAPGAVIKAEQEKLSQARERLAKLQ